MINHYKNLTKKKQVDIIYNARIDYTCEGCDLQKKNYRSDT